MQRHGHFYTTVACLSCTWTCMDNRSRCCSWRCLDNKRTELYLDVALLRPVLHMDVSSVQMLETHMDNRSCAAFGHVYTEGACSAPGSVYTTAQGPELYLHNKSVSFSWTHLQYRVLCWTRMCLHWRGLCCSRRYLCQAQGPELRQDNRSMCCFWTYLHYKALFCNWTCFPYRGTSCSWTSLHYWVLCIGGRQ